MIKMKEIIKEFRINKIFKKKYQNNKLKKEKFKML